MPKGRCADDASAVWNRESVIVAILQREAEGLSLNSEAVKEDSRPLHSAGIRYFGSWRNTLRATGIDVSTVERRRIWSKTKIIAQLRALCRQGRSLRQTDVQRHDGGLCRAACLAFGSWCNALVVAGINPEPLCRYPQWDGVKIIEAILLRAVRGEALGSTTVRPYTLKSAAVRQFGSWPAALSAAGLEPAQYLRQRTPTAAAEREEWSKERVRKGILQRHALGLPIYGNSVLRDDRALFAAGRKWFTCWSKALEFAGFDPAQYNGNRR